jgi:hypothetical protein
MKRFIVIVPLLLVLTSASAFAQATCTIDCCNQCFPYNFCTGDSTEFVMCSNAPNEDGTPAKSWIPSCVEVDVMRPQGIWMPQTAVPDFTEMPPNRWSIFLAYESSSYGPPPWTEPYDPDSDFWSDDTLAYAVGWAQWDLDSATFLAGDTQEYTYYDETDFNQQSAFLFYVEHDYQELWEIYDPLDSTWEYDSTLYYTGNDVPYSQIWSDSQANNDANLALQNWLNQCDPAVPPTGIVDSCCLHMVLDTVAADFSNPLTILAETVNNLGGSGFPTCSETMCPFFARFVNVNVSSAFFYQSNIPREQHPDTTYILHSVPKFGFYTSETSPPSIYKGFNEFSFYQLAEHEIGHFLGLEHPNQKDGSGMTCSNCYTQNPLYTTDSLGNHIFHPTGFHTVMAGGNNIANSPPLALTNEDECQFQKLYCPESCLSHGGGCALDGVSQPAPVQDWFNPEVFPNPTSGGMTLTFTLSERSLTQIAIYDVLGNQVRFVSSGYEESGPQSISLGTESLPSGNYVCRVRVGDRVSYINLAITK